MNSYFERASGASFLPRAKEAKTPRKESAAKIIKQILKLVMNKSGYSLEYRPVFPIKAEVINDTVAILKVCPNNLMVPRVEEAIE